MAFLFHYPIIPNYWPRIRGRFSLLRILGLVFAFGVITIAFIAYRSGLVRTIRFESKMDVERRLHLSLVDVTNVEGYYSDGKDAYSWIRFNLTEQSLHRFISRNNFGNALVSDSNVVDRVLFLNRSIEPFSKNNVANWIDGRFSPSVAYSSERLHWVAGKIDQTNSDYSVFLVSY